MNKELLTKLKHKKETHERSKQGQATCEEYRDTVQACRDKVRKAKVSLVLHLARDMKHNKKGFCKCISNKRKTREKGGATAEWSREDSTKNRENTEVLNAIFTLDFSSKTCIWQSQVPETSGKVRSKQDLPLVKED